MVSDKDYLTAVESIYDAATDPSLWPAALAKIAASSGGVAFMSMRDPATAPESWPVRFAGMEQSWVDAFKHFAPIVPWAQSRVPRRAPGTAVPSEAVITRSDLLKTEWYNDFMRPQELISGIGVTVLRDQGGRFVSAGMYVPLAFEARHAECIALVQRVTPHLERALKVNRQLNGADFRWQAAEQSFDRLTVGVILLSPDMRVQFANGEAERILSQHDGLGRDREGHLLAASADDDARLRASVRSVIAGLDPRAGNRGGVLAVRRRSGRRAYGVLISAVRAPDGMFGPVGPRAMIFVSEARARQASDEQLASTFGLTPAEGRLLHALLQGHGLTEAAARLGNSVNTSKTHLRALFDKLDCSRQADLVRTVTSHPVWLVGGGS